MARGLATLLGREHDKLLLLAIDDLEKATRSKGIDTLLIGDILRHGHEVIRLLKLDSSDSTAKELYNSLRAMKNKDVLEQSQYSGLIIEGACISLNVNDIKADIAAKATFENRSLRHLQKSLKAEIIKRYKQTPSNNDKVVARLLTTL